MRTRVVTHPKLYLTSSKLRSPKLRSPQLRSSKLRCCPFVTTLSYFPHVFNFVSPTLQDCKPSAQFEHQLLCNAAGVEILTARLKSSPPLWWEEGGGAIGAPTI